jgi:hypothetical protein
MTGLGPRQPITKLHTEMRKERSARRAGTTAHHPIAGFAGKAGFDSEEP